MTSQLHQVVVAEIKRLAEENAGRPPGRRTFEQATGIREGEWLGVIWARWGDALQDAGFSANRMQGRADRDELLKKLFEACEHFRRMPTVSEYELLRAQSPSFPAYKTFQSNFGAKENIIWNLRQWLSENDYKGDLIGLLPIGKPKALPNTSVAKRASTEGYVYLLHSGKHYKIGRSDELEKRVKQISIALPESVTLAHAIKTDDPVGIEAYWHKRFADRRANGEWFKLESADVQAFKRRSYQ